MGAIKKTLFFGGLMSAGLVWLTGTKKGKEVRDQLLDHSAEIYLNVKKKIQKIDKKYNVSKGQYLKLAKEAMNEYFDKYPVPATVKSIVQKVVVSQWETLKGEAAERVNETKRVAKSAFKKKTSKRKKA